MGAKQWVSPSPVFQVRGGGADDVSVGEEEGEHGGGVWVCHCMVSLTAAALDPEREREVE